MGSKNNVSATLIAAIEKTQNKYFSRLRNFYLFFLPKGLCFCLVTGLSQTRVAAVHAFVAQFTESDASQIGLLHVLRSRFITANLY